MPDDTTPAICGDRCDATTSGGTQHPITLGPCTHRRGHDAHRDATGYAWFSPGQADARERAEQAEAALARVRDLHQRNDQRRPLDLSLKPIIHCAHCNNDWPCDTIRALDSVEPTRSKNAAGPMSQTPS